MLFRPSHNADEAPRGMLEQQLPLNAGKQCTNLFLHTGSTYNMNLTTASLSATNETASANSHRTKKRPGKINFYDPIHQHSTKISQVEHLSRVIRLQLTNR